MKWLFIEQKKAQSNKKKELERSGTDFLTRYNFGIS